MLVSRVYGLRVGRDSQRIGFTGLYEPSGGSVTSRGTTLSPVLVRMVRMSIINPVE